jgi:hypothetical protein
MGALFLDMHLHPLIISTGGFFAGNESQWG